MHGRVEPLNLPVLRDMSMHRRAERLNLSVLRDRSMHRHAARLDLPLLRDRLCIGEQSVELRARGPLLGSRAAYLRPQRRFARARIQTICARTGAPRVRVYRLFARAKTRSTRARMRVQIRSALARWSRWNAAEWSKRNASE